MIMKFNIKKNQQFRLFSFSGILIITVIFSICSCNTRLFHCPIPVGRNYYSLEGDGARPIDPCFWLAYPTPYRLQKGDNIDTTAIYINKDRGYDYYGKPYVVFLRFFANGRCASGYLYKDSLQYNAPSKQWTAGYYKMHNPNKVELEEFVAHSPTSARYDQRMGVIRGDTIYVFSRFRRKKTPIPPANYKKWTRDKEDFCCDMYIKQKVDTLTGTPDW